MNTTNRTNNSMYNQPHVKILYPLDEILTPCFLQDKYSEILKIKQYYNLNLVMFTIEINLSIWLK